MRGQCAVLSATIRGVEAVPVFVEVTVSSGLPGMSIVGMPDAAVQEARERVRASVRSSGFSMPQDRIVVNLAPSSLRKTGSGFDLPIAVGILVSTGQIDAAVLQRRLFVGELSPRQGSQARCGYVGIRSVRPVSWLRACLRAGQRARAPLPISSRRRYRIWEGFTQRSLSLI